jgi:hypothetical protein
MGGAGTARRRRPARTSLPVYAEQRRIFDRLMAEGVKNGDDPAVVAKAIVTAATDAKAEAALRRRSHGRARQDPGPPRSCRDLRQPDPQDEQPGRLTSLPHNPPERHVQCGDVSRKLTPITPFMPEELNQLSG